MAPNWNWWECLGPGVAALAVEFRAKYGDDWPHEYYRHDGEGMRMGDAALGDMKEKYGPEFSKLASKNEGIAFAMACCASVEMDEDFCAHTQGSGI